MTSTVLNNVHIWTVSWPLHSIDIIGPNPFRKHMRFVYRTVIFLKYIISSETTSGKSQKVSVPIYRYISWNSNSRRQSLDLTDPKPSQILHQLLSLKRIVAHVLNRASNTCNRQFHPD